MKISELLENIDFGPMPMVLVLLRKAYQAKKRVKFETLSDDRKPLSGRITKLTFRSENANIEKIGWCAIQVMLDRPLRWVNVMPTQVELEHSTLKKSTDPDFDFVVHVPNSMVTKLKD